MVPAADPPTVALLVLLLLLLPLPAEGQFRLWRGEAGSLEVGGYLRTLSGVSRAAFQLPDQERTTAFNAEVLRLEWDLRLGERVVVAVHDKLQLEVTTAAATVGGPLAGFGVSAVPDRTVDLRSDFIQREGVRAWHDIDRLSVTVYTGAGDVTVGRQAITWGVSSLFPVADLWARFSPFELDTSEKPGIDAVRWLSYPGRGWEVDAVLADRGSSEELSLGGRGTVTLPWADLWVGAGKLWREAMVMGGISAPVGAWKLRAEAVLARDIGLVEEDGASDGEADADGPWQRPRITVGVDWLGGGVMVTGEYHHNGIGATDPDRYPGVLRDRRFRRGESYFLGRHYLGGLVSWTPGNDRLALSLSGIVNLQDPSSAWTPVATYDLGRSARVSLGAVVTTGEAPTPGATPRLESEYGSYGSLGFTRVSLYF